ncbi:MAG TPA: hypothetical protein VI233_08815 [Puia sp.]
MKWLLIGFLIIQLGVDLAHSVTLFPFMHYGMFSESFKQPDSLAVYRISINDKPLLAKDFRIGTWDMVQGPLQAFEQQQVTHDFSFDKQMMESGLAHIGAAGIFHWASPRLDNDRSVPTHFPSWYRQYLSRLLGSPVQHLRVDKVWYRYTGGELQSYRSETWINS